MPTPSVAVIDALNSLLEAEANSIFHFVGKDSPYLKQASPAVRRTLEQMWRHLEEHTRELSQLIRELGGEPSHPPKPNADEQYLAFLSLKFLLPKLVDAKELMVQRYQSALGAVGNNDRAKQTLSAHLQQMQADLNVLRDTANEVAADR